MEKKLILGAIAGDIIGVSIRRNTHCSDCSYVRPLHLQ